MEVARTVYTYCLKTAITALCLVVISQATVLAQVTPIPDMPYPRVGMCSARMENTIYFIGGAQGLQGKGIENVRGTSTVQAFDFETMKWKKNIAPLETPRVFACAVALDDSIYVMGGVDSLGRVLNSVEVYSPESNTWHYDASMRYGRKGAAATVFDGRILVFGGGDSANVLHREVESYDPEEGKWTVLPYPMLFGRAFHHVAKVGNSVYIFGGVGAAIGPISIIERYVPDTGVVSVGLTWRNSRAFFGSVVREDSVFVISGYGVPNQYNSTGYLGDVEVLNFKDPANVTEETVKARLQSPRRGFVAALGDHGVIYLFGGVSPNYKNGQVPLSLVSGVEVESTAVSVVNNSPVGMPSGFSLDQNYPNPFNPTTIIHFNVPSPGSRVSLNVYNMLGQRVRTLVDGYMNAGSYDRTFDGENLPSGAYIYRLETNNGSLYRKMVLIK